jgi:lipoprotein-anchoring transpeptidase ErfK/SrfK
MKPHITSRAATGRRGTLLLSVIACLLAVLALPLADASGQSRPATSQRLAVLLTGHLVRTEPSVTSPVLTTVSPTRPLTGERTALPVVARKVDGQGIAWIDVMLPGRPNGSTGWIAQQGTLTSATSWRLQVNLARRRVSAYWRGKLVKSFSAVVGKPSTPTPTGRFFVEESVRLRTGEPGGPFALTLSARSNVLQEFEGGPGQIGIHGRDNLGGHLGSAESHGCVRLATSSIDWLVARIVPGVPVRILG